MIEIKSKDGRTLHRVDADTLRGVDLSGQDLRGADMNGADLREADLRAAVLRATVLNKTILSGADLRGADLREAKLMGAYLRGADLREADLREADLRDAMLSGANMNEANLSGATGLPPASDYLAQFEHDDLGVIVYRAEHGYHGHPQHWDFTPGKFLTEIPNSCRTTECGCGVSFAPLEWVRTNHPDSTVWRCRIKWMDLADVVVPYNTDGKARCARLELLKNFEGNPN